MPFGEVTRHRRAGTLSDDKMDVQGGLAFWTFCDIADQRGDLDLLVDRDPLILLALPIELEKDNIAQGSNGGKLRRRYALAPRELL
jgi:hypothetical protein